MATQTLILDDRGLLVRPDGLVAGDHIPLDPDHADVDAAVAAALPVLTPEEKRAKAERLRAYLKVRSR